MGILGFLFWGWFFEGGIVSWGEGSSAFFMRSYGRVLSDKEASYVKLGII